MNGPWIARINDIIDAVRNDPGAPHTLATLAADAHAAPRNFHRRFLELVGETPAEFVRRSRLERATYMIMAAPERTFTDIAIAVGFSDSSDFSRSFRRHYGVSPSAWSREQDQNVRATATSPHVHVINRPAMRLATITVPGVFGRDDLRSGYGALCDWMQVAGLDLERSTLVGASFDNYRTTPHDRIRYTFGFEVPLETEASGMVVLRELPAFAAASVAIDGSLSSIADAWNHLYDDWFPSRPWNPAPMPALKLFHRRPDEVGWDYFVLDCVIPFRMT